MFKAIYQTKHGDTVSSDDPRRDALKQAAYISAILKLRYLISYNLDKTITVKDMQGTIAPITFEKES